MVSRAWATYMIGSLSLMILGMMMVYGGITSDIGLPLFATLQGMMLGMLI
jgi:hypothetical protein